MKMLIRKNEEDNNIINFERVFKLLNDELFIIGESLELICAGGYVMQLHGYRGTVDVDAFYESNSLIDDIIKKVGDKLNINRKDELWLNNSISNMNPTPSQDYCEIAYEFPNLLVKAVSLKYLIGMKLRSGREQDLIDVAAILKRENNEQPFELLSQLEIIGFSVDISDLLDAFGTAYGIEWLDNFYGGNETKLREYF